MLGLQPTFISCLLDNRECLVSLGSFTCAAEEMSRAALLLADVVSLNLGGKIVVTSHLMRRHYDTIIPKVENVV